MIDAAQIEAILTPISGNRAGAIREKNGGISMLLDVTGLAADARAEMEQALRTAIAPSGAGCARSNYADRRTHHAAPDCGGERQGRGRQIDTVHQSCGRDGIGGSVGGPGRCRHLRTVAAAPDGRRRQQARGRRQQAVPGNGAGGVPFLSMGQLAKPGQAIAWRGPMAGKPCRNWLMRIGAMCANRGRYAAGHGRYPIVDDPEA